MRRTRRAVVAVAAICLVFGFASATAEGGYKNSPPQFDRVTMLRVAMGYNLSRNATDLSFPATSKRACEIAGVSVVTWINIDHAKWAKQPGPFAAVKASIEAVLDQPFALCVWLHSEAAEGIVPGLPRVWRASLKPNFKRLRRGLRTADCKDVNGALDRYPEAGLSAGQLHQKIVKIIGGPCGRRHR